MISEEPTYCCTCDREMLENDLSFAVKHCPGEYECIDCYTTRADQAYDRWKDEQLMLDDDIEFV